MGKFSHTFVVGIRDINQKRELSNFGCINILEDLANLHSESVQDGLLSERRRSFNWVLIDWKVEIYTRPKYAQEITVNTWSASSNRFFSYRDFEMFSNGERVAIATSKWMVINEDFKPLKITPDITSPYDPIDSHVFPSVEIEKLHEPKNFDYSHTDFVHPSQIDVIGHLHNSYYLALAYDSLPKEIRVSGEEAGKFHILYKNQLLANEKIHCLFTQGEKTQTVTIKSCNDETLNAIVQFTY